MKVQRQILAITCICVLAATNLLAQSEEKNALPSWQDKYATNRSHDFGEVAIGKNGVHEFEIKNPNDQELTIKSVNASCGCTAISINSKKIKPGDSAKLTVRLNTQRFRGKRTSSIHVRLDDPNEQELQFSITVDIRNINVEPSEVLFTGIPQNSEARRIVKVTRGGSSYWKIKEVQVTDPSIKTKILDTEIRPQFVSYTIECLLLPTAQPGNRNAQMLIKTNDSREPTLSVPILVNVQPPIAALPSSVDFGRVKSGVKVTKKILIQTTDPSQIVKLETKNADFSVSELKPETKKVHILNVVFSPRSDEAANTELLVATNTGHSIRLKLHANSE